MPIINMLNGGLEDELRKLGMDMTHAYRFMDSYKINCSDVLYCVKNIQFDVIQEYWSAFWQPEDDDDE